MSYEAMMLDRSTSREKGPVAPVPHAARVVAVSGSAVTLDFGNGTTSTTSEKQVHVVAGDMVETVVQGRRLVITANYTHPVTDDSKAGEALNLAQVADVAATQAQQSADDAGTAAHDAWDHAESALTAAGAAWDYAAEAETAAGEAKSQATGAAVAAGEAWQHADEAKDEAERANRMANGALAGLGTLESVIDTVDWFATHKKASTDTTVNPDKTYYIYDESSGTLSAVDPDGTESPSAEGWYELDETIQNYVATHVAETDDGLYVLSTAAGWRVLVSTGVGDYVAGVFIIDPQGVIRQALTGAGITFSESMPFTIGGTSAFIQFDGNGHISIGGAGVSISGGVTIGGTNRTLAQTLVAVEYGVGSSPTSHSDITSWSSSTPAWSEGSYVWQRTTNANETYTYTCIQGAKGDAGDDGAQILGITTAPSSYTTTVGGFTPVYRIALSTVKTQSGASEVRVGDVLAYSYYHYPVGHVDSSYVYCGARKSLRGAPGSGVTITKTEYGTAANASTEPSSWSQTAPTALAQGTWLWVKTTYSDGSTATTKSYVGTDGEDGKSVYVQSSTKTGDTTTIVIADTDGHTDTITIKDGTNGTNGTPGANGLNGYIHFAWANSSNGSQDFSTTVSENKKYLGTYSDNTETDSESYGDYTWSLIKGADGTSVTVRKTEYGVSSNASTEPSSWNQTVPTSIAKGNWLWAKTTYSDNTTATTKSYVGTDGEDGKSVYVKSSSKAGDVTTVVLTDGTTDTTLTITDGTDGQNGTPGLNGYVHTAWATSADGAEGFSTTVSTGKTYLGVCTDNNAADPTTPSSYSWSLIKGAKGDKGDTPSITATKSGSTTTIKVDGTTIATVEDGTDGTTPTVTTRTNQDGSTTIVINGSDSATIENGTDGKSYYTYVRYSENSNGSNMVSTPTASTKYIGVYTGQSSSVPAYTSFTWSKYVGENGTSPDPLTVTGTAVDYQLSESGTTKPTGNWSETPLAPTTTQYLWTRTTITFSDGSNVVTYSVGGKVGQKGDTGPEAVVTIYPTAIDWGANTATLAVSLRVDGVITTPSSYKWTKGTSTTSLGTAATLSVTDLNETYHCTVTW